MIISSNEEKTITIELSNGITIENGTPVINNKYKVDMPTVYCSTAQDANYIQSKINEYIIELSHKLLEPQ